MISIIIPVFNSEKYLEECLNSIYIQTYKDIEIILINDGSTDKSIDIINKYKNKFEKFIYLEQENKGASEARNLGVKYSSGEYLLFIDADDYIEKKSLEMIYQKANSTDSDIIIIGHKKFYNELDLMKSDNYIYNVDEDKVYTNIEVIDMILNFEVKGYICDKVFKRSKWLDLNIKFERRRYVEDWFPITKYIGESDKISFINKPIYYYRQHEESSIHNKNIKVIEDYNYAVKNIVDYIESTINYNKNSMDKFKLLTFNETIHELYDVYIDNKSKIYKEFYNYKFNDFGISNKRILSIKNINLKNKISTISWNCKIYHVLKLLV